MHVRYLLNNVFASGGTISTTISTANQLVERGHQVEIASVLRRKDAPSFHIDPRVAVTVLTDTRRGSPDRVLRSRTAPSTEDPADETRAYTHSQLTDQRIRAWLQQADGVIIGTRPSLNLMVAKYGSGSAVRIGMEHVNLHRHRQTSPDFQLPAMAKWYPCLDAFVTLTNSDAADYREMLPTTRIETIPNAANTLAANLSAATTNPVIISAGRLVSQKGYDRLIAAFARVAFGFPDWQLHIYGGGETWPFDDLIQELGMQKQIRMMGFTQSLPTTMSEAGIFAMASRFEGMPMVMLEAIGVGLPVATYDFHSGASELTIDGENGFLVADDDEVALGAALAQLMSDPALRQRMGGRSKEFAEQFHPDIVMARWESLLASLAPTSMSIAS